MAGRFLSEWLAFPKCGMLCPTEGDATFFHGTCDRLAGHRGPCRTYDEFLEATVYFNRDGSWLIEPEDPRVQRLRDACDE